MKHISIILFALLFQLTSCRVTQDTLCGEYAIKDHPKTVLKLNQDHTFEFLNQDLDRTFNLSEAHDFYFYKSFGVWRLDSIDRLFLNSNNEYKVLVPNIIKREIETNEPSIFTFFNGSGEKIPIDYILTSNGAEINTFGGQKMMYYPADLYTEDSLTFKCFGYKPWLFVKKENKNFNFDIYLQPILKPNHFIQFQLKVKKNKLIDSGINEEYIRK